MKTLTRILLLQSALALSSLADEPPKTVPIAWVQISAIIQNLRFYVQEGDNSWARRDPKYFENAPKRMEILLDELVKDGSLVKETIHLKSIADIGDGISKITSFAEEIGQIHGYYVSLELIDFGMRRGLAQDWSKRDLPFSIVVHLPQDQLKQFKEVLKVNEFLAEPEAEQDGTRQPATRPESKSKGGDKPQPESEGRSR